MSGISSLIQAHTLEAKGGKGKPAKKAAPKKPAASKSAPAASKSLSGLQKKLDALSKKYTGLTFSIKEFKNKKNAVVVKGVGKMLMSEFEKMALEIPNTSHIPQRIKNGMAVFTLFGAKELTGSAEAPQENRRPFALLAAKGDAERGKFLSVLMKACSGDEGKKLVAAFNDKDADTFNALWDKVSGKVTAALTASDLTLEAAAKPKPKGKDRSYYILVERSKSGGKWSQQFGAYEKKVVTQEMADNKESNRYADKADKMEYKVLTVPNATQKACNEAVKELNLTASEPAPKSSLSQFLSAQSTELKKKVSATEITATVFLNPVVGDVGVVFRDASSTDDQFVSSTHENDGDRYFAKVVEVKAPRLRVDIMTSTDVENGSDAVAYKDAWIYATNFYQTAENALMAAIVSPSMIDTMILQKVADGARKSEDGSLRIADLRKSMPADVSPEATDAALTRMYYDQVLNLKPGSLSDVDGLKIGTDKFSKIYPSDSLMQLNASDNSALMEAKKTYKTARSDYDKKPGPQTKSRLQAAKEALAKLLKKVSKESPVPFAGPAKPKRMAGRPVMASEDLFIVKVRNEDGTSYYGPNGMSFIRKALAKPLNKKQAEAIVKQYSRPGQNRVEMLPFDSNIKMPEVRRGDAVMVYLKETSGKLVQDDKGEEWYGEVVAIENGKVRIRFEDDPHDGTPESFIVVPLNKVTLAA